jgi:hypothetical protein
LKPSKHAFTGEESLYCQSEGFYRWRPGGLRGPVSTANYAVIKPSPPYSRYASLSSTRPAPPRAGGRRILIALRAVRRARIEYALGKREEGKREEGNREEGKREEGAVGHFECHLGAVWGVIWEPFGRSFGGSFGASFGGHFPPPWEVPISK